MWVANKPKEIKIEAWQARPPYTGKKNIYLINSVPKQQPTSLPQRAVPTRVCMCVCVCACVCMCECVHTYARPQVHVYTCMDR